LTKESNRMPGLVVLPNAVRTLVLPLDRAAGRRGEEGKRSLPSRVLSARAKWTEMAPQMTEKIESAPGNGAPSRASTEGLAVFDRGKRRA
jgi:hypothetical protein